MPTFDNRPSCASCGATEPADAIERGVFALRWDAELNARACRACREGVVITDDGPDRGYVAPGGLPTHAEFDRAARRVMGDAEFERQAELDRRFGQTPSPARTQEELDLMEYDRETARRIRVDSKRGKKLGHNR